MYAVDAAGVAAFDVDAAGAGCGAAPAAGAGVPEHVRATVPVSVPLVR